MTAYNIIGESPASAPVEVYVGEAGKQKSESMQDNHLENLREEEKWEHAIHINEKLSFRNKLSGVNLLRLILVLMG